MAALDDEKLALARCDPMLPRRCILSAIAGGAALALVHTGSARAETCAKLVCRVGQNHGHVLGVSLADAQASVERTYSLKGDSAHDHAITISQEQFAAIHKGEVLRVTSTASGGHRHRLLVRCAPSVEPPERINACETLVAGKDDHDLIIPKAHLDAPKRRTYVIDGIAPHVHPLTLELADFNKLLQGEQVVRQTDAGDGHTHMVYIRYLSPKASDARSRSQ